MRHYFTLAAAASLAFVCTLWWAQTEQSPQGAPGQQAALASAPDASLSATPRVPAAPADSRNPSAKHVAAATPSSDILGPTQEFTVPARPAELESSATLDSQSVAGAVASDPRFLTAIEERLNDPDPATQEAAAQLLDEFLDAAGVAEAPDANKP